MEPANTTFRLREGVVPNPKLRLREQFHEVMRFKQFSRRTEEAYWIRHYIFFHGKRHPREMGKPEIEAFLSHLTIAKKVAVSTQNQALNALVFLYRAVLHQPFDQLGAIERPVRRPKVPCVKPGGGGAFAGDVGVNDGLDCAVTLQHGLRLLEGLHQQDLQAGLGRV